MKAIKLLLVLLLVGCAQITYDTEAKRVSYIRIGNQELQDVYIIKDDKIIKISLGGQHSDNDAAIAEILKLSREIVKRIPAIP